MKKVAKLVIVDKDDNYLLMYRSNHPAFGDDPDLPGGTVEEGESTLDAMIREVNEEIGVAIDKNVARKVYAGAEYSAHDTHYELFVVKLDKRPEINMSWEHKSYEWLALDIFLERSKNAMDSYMHMVHDTIKGFSK